MNKGIFLDRDGVLNEDNVNYTWTIDSFIILPGVAEALEKLKVAGFKLIVVTNQSGIAKGIYLDQDVLNCHQYLQEQTGNFIDELYYCPYHYSATNNLSTKPETLNFEKAIAKFNLDTNQCWMIGDTERDLIPAKKLGIKTILIPSRISDSTYADFKANSLLEACNFIL